MKTSDIYKVLEDFDYIPNFIFKYKYEFDNYSVLMNKKGVSIPVLVESDFNFVFEKSHLINISKLFLTKRLSEIQINYIVDCILLSDKIVFNNEEILSILESYTDREVNGGLTFNYVKQITNNFK